MTPGQIRDTRVNGTTLLSSTLANLKRKPRVLILTASDKTPLPDFMAVDLLIQGDHEPSRSIMRGLAAGEFSIDTTGYLRA